MTSHLGRLLAETGGFFAFLSPILGWIGVAVTGSDTSANALFGALQVQAAVNADLDPVLLAAAAAAARARPGSDRVSAGTCARYATGSSARPSMRPSPGGSACALSSRAQRGTYWPRRRGQ